MRRMIEPTQFVYLRREPRGVSGRLVWILYRPDGVMESAPWFRLRQHAQREADKRHKVVLPEGVTPELYRELWRWYRLRPHNWRAALLATWSAGVSNEWQRELRDVLGPAGLAKLKM